MEAKSFKEECQRREKMQTAKNEVAGFLERLPDNCTLEDVQYHLYVIQKIERGLKDCVITI